MDKYKPDGWCKLIEGYNWFSEVDRYWIPAYSEFMPPPRLGKYPYSGVDYSIFSDVDPYGWKVPEIEEQFEIQPGLMNLTDQIMREIVELGQGQSAHRIAGHQQRDLVNNPYWPKELAEQAGHLGHERYVVFLPLALSKTQDDKGRVRWTFFGGSEQGPEKAFWKSFYQSPEEEHPSSEATDFLRFLISTVYKEELGNTSDLYRIGFRILPNESNEIYPHWNCSKLPLWVKPFLWNEVEPLDGIRFLLTFKPFSLLPDALRQKYLTGQLMLLPFPGSLVFWGMQSYRQLQKELPLAMQLPLQMLAARHSGLGGIKVPQSGWFHEPGTNQRSLEVAENLLSNIYRRSHRWDRVERYEDEIIRSSVEDSVGRALFSTELDALKLYNKPMARNCQIWTLDSHLLLDGPNANHDLLERAALKVSSGGTFGYRMQFPAMRLGQYEVYWQRPLVAYWQSGVGSKLVPNKLYGYLTAYRADKPDPAVSIDLWPRLLDRKPYQWALRNFTHLKERYRNQTALNIIRLLDVFPRLGNKPIPRDLAFGILRIPEQETLDSWLASLPEIASNHLEGESLRQELEQRLEPVSKYKTQAGLLKEIPTCSGQSAKPLTLDFTAKRTFEEAWWRDIYNLSQGEYINKNNADCVQDSLTAALLKHRHRDLEPLGEYLLNRHSQSIFLAGMEKQSFCGELRFSWKSDFDFANFGGWKNNQEGHTHERNLVVIIPGKNHNEAVVMADHYDTAYMENIYDKSLGGTGARIAAPGADDNHSATATLLQAAPIFLNLSQQGLLERDIWLIHLTGEEFPSDCLGSRSLAQALVEKKVLLHSRKGEIIDFSGTQMTGIFLMDMIGHNLDFARDVFQISPGKAQHSLKLARQVLQANYFWNLGTKQWNRSPMRHGKGRSQRSPDNIPPLAEHLQLHGQVRLIEDPESSLYNTDGQIFSDCGIPVVLIMENYDLKRSGYHDTQDTMSNIDLDYGSALASIAIEAVASAANCRE
ncbi:MAG TPA: M28 family peptidase [Dehalococcoidales bacterium]|nr:M28 family peptidase [Dehalococcoidales bacterium]